jgi:glutathione synthase/RimK-type ligase-like ATP-grasp enzyme
MKSTILIITEEFDPHADTLIGSLRTLGHEPIRLHTADFPLKASFGLRLGPDTDVWQGHMCSVEGKSIDVETIRSVWWRRPAGYQLPEDLSEDEHLFVREELSQALRGLWNSLESYWISHPEDIRRASYKLEQLQRAQRLGFEIPRTLTTMNPQDVQDFYEACAGNIIYKTFAQTVFEGEHDEPGKAIYTTPIGHEQLALLETVKTTPCLFQEYIPKQVELRVTVVGNQVFTAAIHSQESDSEKMKVDWRHYEAVPYRKAVLPDDVARRCLEYVHSYNLNYSAMDLILTPDGRYVFLENNPNGQWGFIQEAVPELNISAALTACLIEGKRL